MKTVILLIVLLFSKCIYADTMSGVFSLEDGEHYENYSYSLYAIDVKQKTLSVKVESKRSTYLILQSPDKKYFTYKDSGGQNRGIVIEEPVPGKWVAIATTYYSNVTGDFDLIVEGGSIKKVSKNEVGDSFIENAYYERGVASDKVRAQKKEEKRLRKMALLQEQLTLDTYRRQLILNLNKQIEAEDKDYTWKKNELTKLIEKESDLKEATDEVAKLKKHSELISELLENEMKYIPDNITDLSDELSKQVSRREAYKVAIEEINKLDALDKKLKEYKNSLLHTDDLDTLKELRKKIVDLQAEVDQVANSIAKKLFESSFDEYLKLGGIDYDKIRYNKLSSSGLLAFRNNFHELLALERGGMFHKLEASDFEHILRLSGNLVSAARSTTVVEGSVNPDVWLPDLFPWPPPDSSSRVVVDHYRNWHSRFKTLGDADMLIRSALQSSGYTGPSYFGVPYGFALVTQMEQTDENGGPLDKEDRWTTAILEMKRFSLSEYIKALLTARPGYYRVIAFIVSSKPFSTSGDRAKFSTIEHWAHSGYNHLPKSVKMLEYSDQHRTTALIYEFQKLKSSDEPHTSVPGRHAAQVHLRRTNLLAYLK